MTGTDGRAQPDGAPPLEYPPPVDPWAAAESTHQLWPQPTEPGLPGEPGRSAGAPGRLSAYRRPVFLIVAATLLVAVGAVATLVVLWQRSTPALDYQPLADVRRVKTAAPVSSGFAATHVVGDRTYLAAAEDGPLEVIAVATGTGAEIWRSTAAGTADWDDVVGIGDILVAFTKPDLDTDSRRMVVLGGDDGARLWDRMLGRQDTVLVVGDRAVVSEKIEGRVIGLELDSGRLRWEHANPKRTSGGTAVTTTALFPVTTVADVAGPTDTTGVAFAPEHADDHRIVQIGADRSARVIDASTGKVGPPQANVADPDDSIIAHNGRLLVATDDEGYRILAYDLEKLGEPKNLLTAPGTDRALSRLTPCGPDRACFLETTGYDADTTQLVAVDAAEGGSPWRTPVPQARTPVPVGGSVLLGTASSPATTTLVGPDGGIRWSGRPGSAARIDAGNVLLLAESPAPYPKDPYIWGQHLGDEPVTLGALSGTRTSTCSWNDAVIACAGKDDFVLRTFAG